MHHVVCVMQPPRMFSITAMVALENFQPPTSGIKQIFCNHFTGEKKNTIQDTNSEELACFPLFDFSFLNELGQVTSTPCTSLFPAIKWGEYSYLPTSQGCCEESFRFMECFHT